jgi:predicted RNase H-like nuclease (RuvC/YqgF family)
LKKETQSKQIGVHIPDSKVWDSFLEYIKSKHGKIYGVAGIELQNALIKYLENPETVDVAELTEKYEKELKNLRTRLKEESNSYNKLRNKHDHLQERFIKSQAELNVLEREVSWLRVAVAKVQKMSLFERLLNRLPDEIKELEEGKDEKID